jgi:hypothetical protein
VAIRQRVRTSGKLGGLLARRRAAAIVGLFRAPLAAFSDLIAWSGAWRAWPGRSERAAGGLPRDA